MKSLLEEYANLRKGNAFIDRRTGSDRAKRLKSEKFVLEDEALNQGSGTLGLPSTEILRHSSVGKRAAKSQKSARIAKYKQARAEHAMQVQEDRELFQNLEDEFKKEETSRDLETLVAKSDEASLNRLDVEFNQYLAMFSIPSAADQEKRDEKLQRVESEASRTSVHPLLSRQIREEQDSSDIMIEISSDVSLQIERSVESELSPPSDKDADGRHPKPLSSGLSKLTEEIKGDSEGSSNFEEPKSNTEQNARGKEANVDSSIGQAEKSNPTLLPAVKDYSSSAKQRELNQLPPANQDRITSLLREFTELDSTTPSELNSLAKRISELARKDHPLFVEAVKSRLKDMNQLLSEKTESTNKKWLPPIGDVLFLVLLNRMYQSESDFHPISQAAAYLFTRYLDRGDLEKKGDILFGLFSADEVSNMLKRKYCPQILNFYVRVLEQSKTHLNECSSYSGVIEISRDEMIQGETDIGGEFWPRVVLTCLAGIHRVSEQYQKAICYPEIFFPVASSMQELLDSGLLGGEVLACTHKVHLSLKTSMTDVASNRSPLNRSSSLSRTIQERTPAFDPAISADEFKKWKEKELLDRRLLKRKLAKERRGAIKELRKDGQFLAQVREVEKKETDRQRLRSQKQFYAELRRFDEDMRQGGQSGMNPHLKPKKKRLWKY